MARKKLPAREVEGEDGPHRSALLERLLLVLMPVLISAAVSWFMTRATVATQVEQVAVAREKLRADEARYREEAQELRVKSAEARFEGVLANLVASEPERRLVGFRSAEPFVRDAAFRDRMRDAIVEAVGRHLLAFNKGDSRVAADDIRVMLKAASDALRQSSDCVHIRETLRGLHQKLKVARLAPKDETGRPVEEVARRREALGTLGADLGQFLFCKFVVSCANVIDFDNVMNGTAVQTRRDRVPGPTERSDVPFDAVFSVNGFAHAWPAPKGARFLDVTGPYPQERGDHLVSLFVACSPDEREAIKTRACGRVAIAADGSSRVPLASCGLLREVKVLEGGWVQRSR